MRIRVYAALGLGALIAARGLAFEKIALVDSYDFGTVYDTETAEGNSNIVTHVQRTGADCILWRNCSGAVMRYQSREEGTRLGEPPLNRMRLPSSRKTYGWMRHDTAEPDIFRFAMEECARRGLRKGVHWPYEENHWASWTLGTWNLAHPQFWCVSEAGVPFHGRCSVGYPEVVEHKLRLLDEVLDRGADVIYIDLMRNGGWHPGLEYTPLMIRRWHERYGAEKPPKDWRDPRWRGLVSEVQFAFFKAIRARLERRPRKIRFILGLDRVAAKGEEYNWANRAIDWRRLARERVIDAVQVMCVDPSAIDPKDVWGSTRKAYEQVRDAVPGLPVYYPIMAYNFTNRPGYLEYAKWLKISDGEAVRKLMEIARDVGGAGIVMEVVDYMNYSDAVCRELRSFTP